MRLAAPLSILLAGCIGAQGEVALPEPDVDAYAEHVHPFAERACGSLDCHGDPGRPLRLYAEEIGLRARDELRGTPLTDAELRSNALALVGIDPWPASLDDHLALRKPLRVGAGGVEHEGDDLWLDRADPAYACLRGWLAGAVDAARCRAAAVAAGAP